MGSVTQGLIGAANRDPQLTRVFSTFTATQSVDLSRHRPRQGAGAWASTSAMCSPRCRRRSAASMSTTSTFMAAPGRSTSRARPRTAPTFPTSGRSTCATMPARWCRCARSRACAIVAGTAGHHPLQQLSLGDDQWRARRRACRRAQRSRPWRRSRTRRCPPATAMNGPAPPIRSRRHPGRPGSSSDWQCCSRFCSSSRFTRAG